MATFDGIGGEDRDVLHGLAVELVKAVDGDDEPACRAKLMQYLDRLEAKYGELPSILATRADHTQEAERDRCGWRGSGSTLARPRTASTSRSRDG
jgi:hypothetical protein